MKTNHAILLALMGLKKVSADEPRCPAWYGQLLLETARQMNIRQTDLWSAFGRSLAKEGDAQVSRLRRGEGSVHVAFHVRNVLVANGAVLPPIILADDEDDIARWAKAGVEMAMLMPHRFPLELAAVIAAVADAKLKPSETLKPPEPVLTIDKLPTPKPLRKPLVVVDRSQSYPADHDKTEKGVVVPPRKPPTRSRRRDV